MIARYVADVYWFEPTARGTPERVETCVLLDAETRVDAEMEAVEKAMTVAEPFYPYFSVHERPLWKWMYGESEVVS